MQNHKSSCRRSEALFSPRRRSSSANVERMHDDSGVHSAESNLKVARRGVACCSSSRPEPQLRSSCRDWVLRIDTKALEYRWILS